MNRPLVPTFLKKAEDRLLKKNPGIWSTRVHLVLYYGILFILVLALIAYIVPDDPRTTSGAPYWIGFVSIISIVGLVLWLIYLLRFNVFKRFGGLKPFSGLITFILYFISALTILSFIYVEPLVETYRANKAYGDDEVINDINSINIKVSQLEYDSLNRTWNRTQAKVIDRFPGRLQGKIPEDSIVRVNDANFLVVDTAMLSDRLKNSDSTYRVNDSTYYFYEAPRFALLQPFARQGNSSVKLLSSYEVYKKVVNDHATIDRKKTVAALNDLIHKYSLSKSYSAYPYADTRYDEPNTVRTDMWSKVYSDYQLGDVNSSIDNILDRKYRWSDYSAPAYIRTLYYLALVFSLLTFIFRHSATRTFFMTLLTGVVLTIITALLMAFIRKESTLHSLMLLYALAFLLISLLAWKIKTRSIIVGIAANLFTFSVAFVPLIFVALHYALLREQQRRDNAYDSEPFENQIQAMSNAELVGIIILLILLATYLQSFYRRWYALPEQ